MTSFSARFVASVVSYSSYLPCRSTLLRRRVGVNLTTVNSRHCVCIDSGTTTTPKCTDPHIILQQMRNFFLEEVVKTHKVKTNDKQHVDKSDAHRLSELSLNHIITCCEQLCQSSTLPVLSTKEWTEVVELLLRAMAETKRNDMDKSVINSSPWNVALRLFLHSSPSLTASDDGTISKQHVTSCLNLLRCCIRYNAPVDVVRAIYRTLRSSVVNFLTETNWHMSYARFLLKIAPIASENAELSLALHKEALCVLLLDAAEDGEVLRPAGLLLSLELLRRLVIWQKEANNVKEENNRSVNAVLSLPSSMTSSSLSLPLTLEPALCENRVNDILWTRLQKDGDAMKVARDVCCHVMRNPHMSLAMHQEAFCRFVAVGMRLSAEETHPILSDGRCDDGKVASCIERTSQSYAQFLDVVSDLLSVTGGGGDGDNNNNNVTDRRAVVRVLEEPCVMRHSRQKAAKYYVSVWFVDHIVKELAIYREKAITAHTQESQHALDSWRLCTQAALRCLQRILLHLPDARRRLSTDKQRSMRQARQKIFCLLFDGVLNGVFHSAVRPGESIVSSCDRYLHTMDVLIQAYSEHDWHWPSVGVFIECLHAWRLHDLLRHVFRDAYQRSESQWHIVQQHNKKKDTEKAPFLSNRWRSPFRLSTCLLVVQSSCDHDDPSTAALTVRHMLRCLLNEKCHSHHMDDTNENEDGEINTLMEGRSLAEWTQLMREDIIPRVNEVFCRTGIDTTSQWLNDLDVEKTAAVSSSPNVTKNSKIINTICE